jgi:hypothetical protein
MMAGVHLGCRLPVASALPGALLLLSIASCVTLDTTVAWREAAAGHLSGSLWWANQGVTYIPSTDEFVFTGAHNLPGVAAWASKVDAQTMRVTASNKDLIPAELQQQGYSHAGDLDFFEGELWVALEGEGDDAPARFLVVDPATLLSRRVVPETGGLAGRDTPLMTNNSFAAVRPSTGHVCSCPYVNVTTVFCYDRITGALASKTRLDRRLDGVQGGAFRQTDGALYIGVDANADGDNVIYAVDLDTGHVAPQIVAHTGFGAWAVGRGIEFEGLAFMEDGRLLRWYGNPPWWFFWWWFSKPLFTFEATSAEARLPTLPAAAARRATTAAALAHGGRVGARHRGHPGARYARAGGSEDGFTGANERVEI